MMVLLTVTPALVEAFKYIEQANTTQKPGSELALEDLTVGNPISHLQIIAVSKTLRRLREEDGHGESVSFPAYRLDELLRGSRVHVEPPKPQAEPTPEYSKLMARLRREEEDRAYERMINPPLPIQTFNQRFPYSQSANIFPSSQADVGEGDEITYADVNRQMTLILNIMISIIACSVAIWLAARHWSTPSRLGLSMGGSGLIGIGEVVVYAGYLKRVKEAKEKGKKEIEIKEIIKTWVIGREDDEIPIVSKTTADDGVRKRKATSK